MSRIRSIKPEFFTSLSVAALSVRGRLTLIGLWTHVDDAGRCIDDARLLKGPLWPLDDDMTIDAIDATVAELAEAGKIFRYVVGGRRYLEVQGWAHQKIDRKRESRYPPPDQADPPFDEPSSSRRRAVVEPSSSRRRALVEPSSNDPEPSSNDPEPSHPGWSAPENDPSTIPRRMIVEPSSSPRRAVVEPSIPDHGSRDHGSGDLGIGSSPIRADVERMCALLADLVEENGCKRPTVGKGWHSQARLLLDKDGRDPHEAERVMRWALADSFWQANVLSMPTFRSKYDTLRLQSQRPASVNGRGTPHQRSQDALDRVADRMGAQR